MNPEVQYRAIRLAAAAGAMLAATACSDATAPVRGLAPQAEPSFAAGGAGGSIVKSMIGLEPLLDASTNIGGPNAISDLGRVVGFSRDAGNNNRPVIWDGSTFPQDLGTLGGVSATARSITPDGSVIVGNSTKAGGNTEFGVRWVRINGAWTIDELPALPGAVWCHAVDIAANGTILGTCLMTSGSGGGVVVWRNGVVTDLGAGSPVAVNANNQILVNTESFEPQIWDLRTNPMTVTSLGKLGGNQTTAWDLNDAGDVVGNARFNGPSSHAFLWTAKKGMVELQGLGGDVTASGINNAGQVVGTGSLVGGGSRAVYWSKGKIYELGVLPGYNASSATAINLSGLVVGTSSATANLRATLWTLR